VENQPREPAKVTLLVSSGEGSLPAWFWPGWPEAEPESRAVPRNAFNGNRSAVGQNGVLRDGKAEAASSRSAGRSLTDAVESLENVWLISVENSGTVVGADDLNPFLPGREPLRGRLFHPWSHAGHGILKDVLKN
jgi:hypothetical protein